MHSHERLLVLFPSACVCAHVMCVCVRVHACLSLYPEATTTVVRVDD